MQLQHVLSVILYHLVQYFLSRTIARTMAGDTLACARLSDSILGLQPRDKAAMLGVKTKEYFPEEFTWK